MNLVPRRGLPARRRRQRRARARSADRRSRASRRLAPADDADWQAHDLEPAGASTRFKVRARRIAVRRLRGRRSSARYNVRNATAAHRGRHRGRHRPPNALPTGCARSPASSGGSRSSASPTASRSTTTSPIIRPRSPKRWPACGAAHPDARIWAVFEPRSASSCRRRVPGRLRARVRRRRRSADRADLPLDAARSPSGCRFRSSCAICRRRGQSAREAESIDDIVAGIASGHRPGDLVVLMSNGGFGGIHQKLLRALGVSAVQNRSRGRFGADRRVRRANRSRRQRARRSPARKRFRPARVGRRARHRADLPLGGGLFRSAAHRSRCADRLPRA